MIQLEPDPAGKQRHDELVEADALGRGRSDELLVKAGGAPNEDAAVGGHAADSSAYAIDTSDSACDITPMTSKRTINVRIEIEIDEEAWATEYGTPVSSVEDYVLNQIWGSPAAEAGAIAPTGYVVEGL